MCAMLLGLIIAFHSAGGSEKADTRIDRWMHFYEARARAIVATEVTDPPQTLVLFENPILRYTNPVRPDAQHGSLHLWTDRGRPRAIGAVWSAEDPQDRTQRNLCYEFHSLSPQPLELSLENTDVRWTPREAGTEWLALKHAPAPLDSRALRLTQMRRIAGEWEAEGLDKEAELRLLPQPLYRYPENVEGPLDGAIFAFVIGTDPELFVVLECSKGVPGTAAGWQISPARLTGTPLTLKNGNDELLWSSPTWDNFSRDRTYDFLYGVEHLTDDDLPSEP